MRLPFAALFEQRNVFLRDPSSGQWFNTVSELLGNGPTVAGVDVSEQTAEGIPTVFACVRVIASAVAQLPLKLYKIGPDKTKSEATDAPLYEVLHDLSNPEMTAYEVRYLMTSHLLTWGSCFASVVRDHRGQVTALWPISPWRVGIDRDERRRLRFTIGNEKVIYDPNLPQLLRLSINSLDGIRGRSVVRVLRESMGLSIALQRFGSSFFGQGATFGGVLTHPTTFAAGAKKNLEESLKQQHQGLDQAHKFVILEEGMKYDRIGIPPEDSQFLETRKFQRSELCGAFGVPPHMIGDLERATFSNIENQSLGFLRDGLEPFLVNWESAIRRDLLGPRAFATYYSRFTRNAMTRGDLKSRSDALAVQRQNGIICANEWRALEELDPISAADGGDKYIVSTQSRPSSPADPPKAEGN